MCVHVCVCVCVRVSKCVYDIHLSTLLGDFGVFYWDAGILRSEDCHKLGNFYICFNVDFKTHDSTLKHFLD